MEAIDVKKILTTNILGPVNFKVEPGYIVAVVGKNGCGKSSLFNCILGIYDYDGIININISSCEQAFIMEKCPFPTSYTPKQLVTCYCDAYKSFNKNTFYTALKKYSISKDCPINLLSKGGTILLQLAFAQSYESKLLILDEPSAHLDSFAREDLYSYISHFVANGGYVFWASHICEELDKRADYVLGLNKKGEQCFFGEKETLTKRYIKVVGTDEQLSNLPNKLVKIRKNELNSVGFIDTEEYSLKEDSGCIVETVGIAELIEFLL